MASIELLEELALAAGPPGAEGEVRNIVRREIGDLGRVSHDALGSMVIEVNPEAPGSRIVLDAHLDEVGFIVEAIDDEGRLLFLPLGGWWGHVLLAQRVEVMTSSGSRLHGVIGCKPPHFLSPREREKVLKLDQMYIDIGTSTRKETEKLGVRVGDPVVPLGLFSRLGESERYCCKAFDDRVGVGLLVEVFKSLFAQDNPPAQPVIGVLAVQEEIGCRGAQTSSFISNPDVAIVLEGTPADDIPGVRNRQGVLGKGPQIRFSDPSALSNRNLVNLTEEVAKKQGIPVQLAVRKSGGTDARSIHLHRRGVPTVVIGIPARNIHTHSSVIDWPDYLDGIKLVTALVRELSAERVAELTSY